MIPRCVEKRPASILCCFLNSKSPTSLIRNPKQDSEVYSSAVLTRYHFKMRLAWCYIIYVVRVSKMVQLNFLVSWCMKWGCRNSSRSSVTKSPREMIWLSQSIWFSFFAFKQRWKTTNLSALQTNVFLVVWSRSWRSSSGVTQLKWREQWHRGALWTQTYLSG